MTAATASSSRTQTPARRRALTSILREESPLSTELAADIAFDICDALASLHASGLVHGDLALARIRLTWPRTATQRDIEIFALDDGDDTQPPARASGIIVKDVPPEQRRFQPIDTRADIWAVGALLKRLLSGTRRPDDLVRLVAACLADDPAARPETIGEVAERIATFTASPPECFARMAERRRAAEDARLAFARREARDGKNTLDRLERIAMERESEGLRTPPPTKAHIELRRLEETVTQTTGSPPPYVAKPTLEVAMESEPVVPAAPPSDDALPAWPLSESAPTSDEYLAALVPSEPPSAERLAITVNRRRPSYVVPILVGGVGLAAVVAIAIFVISAVVLRRAPEPTTTLAPTPKAAAPQSTSASAVTPASLPDARLTPDGLPNAKPAKRALPRRPKPAAVANAPAPSGAPADSATPDALSAALAPPEE
jgi:serine/threonine protein kinase